MDWEIGERKFKKCNKNVPEFKMMDAFFKIYMKKKKTSEIFIGIQMYSEH